MNPADIIDDNIIQECGILHIGLEFCPAIDFNDNGEPYICGTPAYCFIDRYNNKQIAIQNRFSSYIDNDDIQACLHSLELDPIMFWYLLLFVYDYCVDMCVDNIKTVEGAGKQIQKFIDMIFEEGKDSYMNPVHSISTLKEIEFDEPVELTLKIGKKKLTITDNNAVGMIGIMCNALYNDYKESYICLDRVSPRESNEYSDSAIAYLFCKVLRYYFDSLDHIKKKRAKGANISNKEKELLSYLLYFTGISKNKNLLTPLLNDYNTLKGLMNPKKKPEFKDIGNWYSN